MFPPTWFLFASLCALFYAAEGTWVKHLGGQGYGPYFIAWAAVTFSTPLLWVGVLLDPAPTVSTAFYFPFAMSVLGNGFALVFYLRAFAIGELSVIFPLLALTPVWMLLTTEAITGEFPSTAALVGIGLIAGGCYGVGLSKGGPLSPFRNLWENPGSRYALLTSVLWSFTSNFDKAAVEASSRFFHPALHGVFLCLLLLPWAWHFNRQDFHRLRMCREGLRIVLLGLIGSGLVLSQFVAVDLAQATYVIAVKRAGMVPGVLIGWKLYGEPFGGHRFLLSLVVLAGLLFML